MRRLNRTFIWWINSSRQLQLAKSNANPYNQRSFLLPEIVNSTLSFSRYYSTGKPFYFLVSFSDKKKSCFRVIEIIFWVWAELQPQLSTDLLKIMEQRLSAIEHRSAYLENLMNRVVYFFILFLMVFNFFCFEFVFIIKLVRVD